LRVATRNLKGGRSRRAASPVSKHPAGVRRRVLGKEVFDAFPTANNDVSEAGMCLAFERGTACVMHCMRILEVGLVALAADLGIGRQNDWGVPTCERSTKSWPSVKNQTRSTPKRQRCSITCGLRGRGQTTFCARVGRMQRNGLLKVRSFRLRIC
jgi:hypothetical protein